MVFRTNHNTKKAAHIRYNPNGTARESTDSRLPGLYEYQDFKYSSVVTTVE